MTTIEKQHAAREALKAKLRRLRDDFELAGKVCLKIKTKEGETKPFIMNRAQRYIHERLEAQLAETGRVRALILKGRQQGASTYISARYYHKAAFRRGVNVYILTHEDPATQNLFNMAKRYNDNNPFAPSTRRDSAKELTFGALDSGYGVGTAGAKATGRSKTTTLFHGSEVAFWTNAADHFSGSVQSVSNAPGTEIILESTAYGVGGEFHKRWQDAERGKGRYIAVFVPWYWQDEYTENPPDDFEMTEDERKHLAIYAPNGMTERHIVWRREKLVELGDELFMQEYPATAAEAFQMTGHDGFIKAPEVLAARKNDFEGYGPLIMGADPARFGNDNFSVALRQGRKVHWVKRKEKCDVVEGATWLKNLIDEHKPVKCFIDVGGVGGGVYDMLVTWGYGKIVVAVNFGGAPYFKPDPLKDGTKAPYFANRRAEMWGLSRAWLKSTGGADIPDEDALQVDACGPKYKYDADQDIVLESKESMRARKISSPDDWDAVALTFAEPVREPPKVVSKPARQASGNSWMGR